MTTNTINTAKKVTLTLLGRDGNAFGLLGAFRQQARREGWSPEEIKEVTDKAMSGDYNNLLATLMEHCQDDQESEEYDNLTSTLLDRCRDDQTDDEDEDEDEENS